MAVDLFEHLLQPAEGGGEGLRGRQEVRCTKAGEGSRVAVFRPPAPGDLLDAATGPLGVLRTVGLDEPVSGLSPDVRGNRRRRHGYTAGFSASVTSLSSINSRRGPPSPLSP